MQVLQHAAERGAERQCADGQQHAGGANGERLTQPDRARQSRHAAGETDKGGRLGGPPSFRPGISLRSALGMVYSNSANNAG